MFLAGLFLSRTLMSAEWIPHFETTGDILSVNTDWGILSPLVPKVEGQAQKVEERTALCQAP